jgi:hypothetical protein
MAKSKWTGETDPKVMLDFLSTTKASDRKLRLYAVACCRAIWPLLTDDRCRRAVETAEDYAEGRVGEQALVAARREFPKGERRRRRQSVFRQSFVEFDSREVAEAHGNAWAAGWDAVTALLRAKAFDAAVLARNAVEVATTFSQFPTAFQDRTALLRCVFHNPYFSTRFDPEWLTPTVRTLAGGIEADHAFDRMPMLADALEEAGCEDAGLLLHCRGEGPHARGCWVVDAILGKK